MSAWDLATRIVDRLGYVGTGFLYVLEGLGVPFFPGQILLAFLGFVSAQGQMAPGLVVAAAAGGGAVGTLLASFVGHRLGRAGLARIPWLGGVRPGSTPVFRRAARLGALLFVTARFIPGLGNVSPYFAGLDGMKAGPLLFALLGNTVWVAAIFSVGYFLESRWRVALDVLQRAGIFGGLTVVALLVAGAALIYHRKRVKTTRQEGASALPARPRSRR